MFHFNRKIFLRSSKKRYDIRKKKMTNLEEMLDIFLDTL